MNKITANYNSFELIDDMIVDDAKIIMKSKFNIVLEYFFEDCQDYLKQIESAYETKDIFKIVSPAHTIKSSARQIGAVKVSEIAKMLEFCCREYKGGEKEKVGMIVEDLKKALEEPQEGFRSITNI